MTMSSNSREGGFALLEAIVAMVIIAVGLLGLAGLNAKSNQFELEALQRVQATLLVNDMAERFLMNRAAGGCYAAIGEVGTDSSSVSEETEGSEEEGAEAPAPLSCGTGDCADTGCTAAQVSRAQADMTAWDGLLDGAASGTSPLIRAKGCIVRTAADEYLISVSWQGLSASAAPAANCGEGEYVDSSATESENWRRTLSVPVRVARLCDSGIGNCND